MTYGMSLWPQTTKDNLEKMNLCERKILRGITVKHRRPDGKYYHNKELYEDVGLKDTVEQINKTKEKYEAKKEAHPNEWYRGRRATLEETRIRRILRNEEYRKTTELWKAMKEKKKKKPSRRGANSTTRRRSKIE